MFNSRKVLSVIAVCVLALACVAGCSGGAANNEPQNAKDVYERYMATDSHDNFNMKGDMNMVMGASGMTMEMPISFDFDVNGKSSHGTLSMSMFGMNVDSESYSVEKDGKVLTYSKGNSNVGSMFGATDESSEPEWTVSESDTNGVADMMNLGKELFDNADFAKNDTGYVVTVKGEDAFKLVEKLTAQSEGTGVDVMNSLPDEYKSLVNSLSLSFDFDKDCNLTKMSIPETKSTIEVQGQSADVTLSCDIALSKHGQIGEITVPDDVVKSAKDAEASE